MPPKKQAASSAGPQHSSDDVPAEEKAEITTSARAVALRKLSSHPSTAIMVREALKALDSRKGVSSVAIQNYIKQKYPSVDPVRLKNLIRRALMKGIDNGTLVRPAIGTTGALRNFRLAPKVKEVKRKSENTDPNLQEASKATNDGAKKTQATGDTKKKKATSEKAKDTKNSKPPKNSKKDEAAPSKVSPAKKSKAKKAEVKGSTDGSSEPTKNKTAKTKEADAVKKPPRKAAKAVSDAPESKATGKRVKKTE